MRPMFAYSTSYVLPLGDSLTAGYGLPARDSFAAKLQQMLRDRHPDATVHNAGVSGDTTADGLRRLPRVLSGLARKPDLAIVEFGANDLLRGVAPARTKANLDDILATLTTCGSTVFLTTFEVPPHLSAQAPSYDGMYADVAARHGADHAPFFPPGVMGDPQLTLPDGLHPTHARSSLSSRIFCPQSSRRLVTRPPRSPDRAGGNDHDPERPALVGRNEAAGITGGAGATRVVITGASSGVGAATVDFAWRGAHLVLAARVPPDWSISEHCRATGARRRCRPSRWQMPVLSRLAVTARDTLGGIDVRFNNVEVGVVVAPQTCRSSIIPHSPALAC